MNKNPCAEFSIKEGHAAINRAGYPATLTAHDLVLISKQINSKIRALGYSSYELFTRRSNVDDEIIATSDLEFADSKHAKKLHSHNPPVNLTPNFSKGDLVMIKNDKSKIKPRDTFIIDSVSEKNGCYWAELFKFGNKLVNKPQLVKLEDLVKVPASTSNRPKRKAAENASLFIKDLVPYIRAIVQSMVPSHSWDYNRMLQMFRSGDLTFEDQIQAVDIPDIVSEELSSEESPDTDTYFSTSDNSLVSEEIVETTENSPNRNVELCDLLDNPSIQMYPQQPSQVDLQSVQNLAEVFDNIYQEPEPRTSNRLALKPKLDYKRMNNPRY